MFGRQRATLKIAMIFGRAVPQRGAAKERRAKPSESTHARFEKDAT